MTPFSIAATIVAISVPSGASAPTKAAFPLLPLTRAQVAEAGAAGTGCSWLSADGRLVLFAAADDRAAIRLDDGVVELRPAAGARSLFPFTFDRWTGGGMAVVVRPGVRSVRRGSESSVRRAVLVVDVAGDLVERQGLLSCGS